MTDSQFQPGQPTPPTPPTQGGGVFGGNSEEIIQDPSMFGPLEVSENTSPTENPEAAQEASSNVATSPFDGYVLPQNTPVVEEITPVVEEVTPVVEEVTPVVEEVAPVVEEVAPEEPVQQKASDIQQKFTNLLDNISELNGLLHKKDGEVLEIIGANSDKISVLYQFGINDQQEIHVKRIETNKEEDETTFNELKLGLNPESNLFEIFLDDVLLFEEEDLLEDGKKKSQVMEKLNKLIFLTESKLKDTQKELRVKQDEEEERRRLQDIFRNF